MLLCVKTHLLSVQSRGTVALPADLRRRLHLDRPDAQIKPVEQDDGRVEVKRVGGAPGVWEMTWSFSGPDGRATFDWIQIDGQLGLRWRRIGGQVIFRTP